MAKSKSFFGLRRGSTKSHTYQVLAGVQITKDRVENVANPQTYNQMLQRVVFATVTQAADKMLPIIGISQQGITNETESRRRWISQNVSKLRDAARRMQQGGAVEAAFAPKGNTQLIPNSYQMSKGSLALVPALVPKTADNGASFAGTSFDPVGARADLSFGTYNAFQLWKALFGVDPGDQLTFPQIYGEGVAQALTGAGGVYLDKTLYTDFCAPRLVFKQSVEGDITISASTTAEQVKEEMKKAIDTDASWYDADNLLLYITFDTEQPSTVNDFILECSEDYDTVFAINNDDPLRAIGCIRSHKDPSTRQWQYSTSDLVCVWADDDRGLTLSDYFGFTLANAIDTYKKNVILDSDGNFLQRGTDDNIVPPSFQ